MSDIVESFPLRKPITVPPRAGSGEPPKEATALDLKLPAGRLVLNLGEPFTTKIEYMPGGATQIEFKIIPGIAKEYLADMTGINSDMLAQLHPLDILGLYDALARIMRPIAG